MNLRGNHLWRDALSVKIGFFLFKTKMTLVFLAILRNFQNSYIFRSFLCDDLWIDSVTAVKKDRDHGDLIHNLCFYWPVNSFKKLFFAKSIFCGYTSMKYSDRPRFQIKVALIKFHPILKCNNQRNISEQWTKSKINKKEQKFQHHTLGDNLYSRIF